MHTLQTKKKIIIIIQSPSILKVQKRLTRATKQLSYKIAFLKRKALSLYLKSDTEELFIMSDGKVFQCVRAATEKDLARMSSN